MTDVEETFKMPSDLDLAFGPQYRLFDVQLCGEIREDWLEGAVSAAGVTRQEIDQIISDGLVRRWQSPSGEPGFLLYTERQITVAKKLRDTDAYSIEELKHIFEDWNSYLEICMIDELAYDSFDIKPYEHFRRRTAEAVQFYSEELAENAKGNRPWASEEQNRQTEELLKHWTSWNEVVTRKEDEELLHDTRLKWRKLLNHLYYVDELARMSSAEKFAILVDRGYSTEVTFNGWQTSGEGMELTHLDWALTLRRVKDTRNEGKMFPLRTPAFTVNEQGVQFSATPSPDEYAALYQEFQLGALNTLLKEHGTALWQCDLAASGRGACEECGTLFDRTSATRRFCKDRCKNRAKARRWRENNPEGSRQAQAKYWKEAYPEIEQ